MRIQKEMLYNRNYKVLLQQLNFVSALYIVFWSCNVVLSVSMFGRELAVFCALLWPFTIFLLEPDYFLRPNFVRGLGIVWLSYIFVIYGFNGEYHNWIQNLPILIFFLLYLIADYYKSRFPQKLKYFFWVILVSVLFFNITTLEGYRSYPNASRLLARSFKQEAFYLRQGIGGYSYVYSVVLLIPFLVYIIKNHIFPAIQLSFLFIVLLLTSLLILINSGYFMALLIGMTVLIFTILIKNVSLAYVLLCIAAVVFIVLIVPNDVYIDVLTELSEVNQNPYIDAKLLGLIESLSTGNPENTTLAPRMNAYRTNIDTIMNSPLLGDLHGGGGHSEIMSFMSRFGIIYGLIYIFLIISFIVECFSFKELNRADPMQVPAIMVILLFFCIGLFNTFGYTMGAIFFIVPAALSHYNNKSRVLQVGEHHSAPNVNVSRYPRFRNG